MMKRQNVILLALVALIAAIPLIMHADADFSGSDDKVKGALEQTEYKPWISAVWEPPSAEVQSFLFALQAAAGAGFLGYFFGYQQGRRSVRKPRPEAIGEDKCYI